MSYKHKRRCRKLRSIQLFICRDQRSKQLLDELNSILKPYRNEVELKVHIVHIKNPEDFENFMLMMEELFGGISTLVFRKYGIRSIPAIVIDDRKVFEGKYPSREELEELLTYEGILLKEIKHEVPTIKVEKIEEVAPTPSPVKIIKPSVEELLPKKEELEEAEFEIEPVERITTVEPELEIMPSTREVETEHIEETVKPEQEVASSVEIEYAKKGEPVIREEVRKVKHKRSCNTCIFYNESTKRCAMLGKIVDDPSNPPCQW